MTLQQVVESYGTDAQKKSVKEGKKWRKESNDNLTKTLRQVFEIVEERGKGQSKIFILDKPYDEIQEREDNRYNNGKGQLPVKYEKCFPIMVLQYLQARESTKPLTVNKWLLNMGFITEEMFEASKSRYDYRVLESEIRNLEQGKVIKGGQGCLVEDYIYREIQRLNTYFMQVVGKLTIAKIITHVPRIMAKCKIPMVTEAFNDNCEEYEQIVKHRYEYVELTTPVIGKISVMEQNLQNKDKYKHLTLREIHNFKNMKIVQEYWKEYKKKLSKITDESGKRLYIVLVYTAHALFIRAGKNPIIKWLEKNNGEAIELYKSDSMKYFLENEKDFHETRHKYIVNLAEKRQEKFNTPSEKVVGANDELGLAGKVVRVQNDPYDEKNKWDKNKELMYLGLYAEAYEKLQEYYGYTFK